MLEGKFEEKVHPRCGYPLWKVQPVGIAIRGTEYMAKCPRCFFYLPVIDVVDPDAPPEPEPIIEVEVVESEPVKPDEIPDGMYWCPKCKTLHRETSKIGINHLEPEPPTEPGTEPESAPEE